MFCSTFLLCGYILLLPSCKSDLPSNPRAKAQQNPTAPTPLKAKNNPGTTSPKPNSDLAESKVLAQQTEEQISEPNSYIDSKPNAKAKPPIKKAVKKSAIKFDLIRYDFGTIVQGDIVDYKFKFSNIGEGPLEIDSTEVTCGCTRPSYPFMPIEKDEEGFIGVRYNSVGKIGKQEPMISIYTNASKNPSILMLRGEVITVEQDSILKLEAKTDTLSSKIDTVK